MTYKFENYETKSGVLNGEFTNPHITVNDRSIIIDDIDKKIVSVEITLTGSDYKVSTILYDLPRNGATGWDDSDKAQMIADKLQEFLIQE